MAASGHGWILDFSSFSSSFKVCSDYLYDISALVIQLKHEQCHVVLIASRGSFWFSENDLEWNDLLRTDVENYFRCLFIVFIL